MCIDHSHAEQYRNTVAYLSMRCWLGIFHVEDAELRSHLRSMGYGENEGYIIGCLEHERLLERRESVPTPYFLPEDRNVTIEHPTGLHILAVVRDSMYRAGRETRPSYVYAINPEVCRRTDQYVDEYPNTENCEASSGSPNGELVVRNEYRVPSSENSIDETCLGITHWDERTPPRSLGRKKGPKLHDDEPESLRQCVHEVAVVLRTLQNRLKCDYYMVLAIWNRESTAQFTDEQVAAMLPEPIRVIFLERTTDLNIHQVRRFAASQKRAINRNSSGS